jgi:hypothetical protein
MCGFYYCFFATLKHEALCSIPAAEESFKYVAKGNLLNDYILFQEYL